MQPSIFEEKVIGQIIGGDERNYEFWTETTPAEFIAEHYFLNDDAAIEWFERCYPVEFAQGVEMRVFE